MNFKKVQSKKVYCKFCKHLLYDNLNSYWRCDVLAKYPSNDNWYEPVEYSEDYSFPSIKNTNNNCKDYEEIK